MIEIKAFSKTYNIVEGNKVVPQTLFNHFNLVVKKGEFIAVVGASGCGKSTLLNAIGLLDSVKNRRYIKVSGRKVPEVEGSGKIFVNSQDIAQLNGNARAEFINQNLGFIFQFHHLIPELNVLQNVALPMRIQAKSTKEASRQAEQLLEEVGLITEKHNRAERRAILSKKPAILSGGERQRVAIARALINQPKVLLADEPTGNLQPSLKTGIMDMFTKLNQDKGITILIVTHDTASLCDELGRSRVDRVVSLSRPNECGV